MRLRFPAAYLKSGIDRPEYVMQGLQQDLIDGGGGGYDLALLMTAGSWGVDLGAGWCNGR